MEVNKRKDERFATKLTARLKSGSLISWGLLCDISENGLFIRGNRNFMLDALIAVEIFMPDNTVSILKGVVRKANALAKLHRKFVIGIEIIEKDAAYKRFLKKFHRQTGIPVGQFSSICAG